MPRRSRRSGGLLSRSKRLPGGSVGIHFVRARPRRGVCQICGGLLHGVRTASDKRKTIASARPNRTFGGAVCSACLKNGIKLALRGTQ